MSWNRFQKTECRPTPRSKLGYLTTLQRLICGLTVCQSKPKLFVVAAVINRRMASTRPETTDKERSVSLWSVKRKRAGISEETAARPQAKHLREEGMRRGWRHLGAFSDSQAKRNRKGAKNAKERERSGNFASFVPLR